MKKYLLTALALIFYGSAFCQTSIYLSANGSSNTFSADAPGNISGLQAKLKQVNPNGGSLNIYFKQGVYRTYNAVTISAENLGGSFSSLNISSAPGERATISGGKVITGWKPYQDGIFMAQLPANLRTMQLFINGKEAVRSRLPNRGADEDGGPYYRIKHFDKVNKTIIVNASDAKGYQNWKYLDHIQMVINQHHFQTRIRIQSITANGNELVITPCEPDRSRIFERDEHSYLDDGKTYFFENAMAFLDGANEWYADTTNNTIYYKPAGGSISPSDTLVVPIAKSVFRLWGTVNSPLTNVSITNLNLAHTNWAVPCLSSIVAEQGVQLDYVSKKYHIPGVIDAKFVNNLKIDNCSIYNAGGNGIVFEKGVKSSTVSNNHIFNIAANGVVIDTYTWKIGNLPDSTKCTNDVIANNLFENEGMDYSNGEAMVASCVSGLIFEHNEIRNLPYTGLQVGNFYGDTNGGVENNMIRFNNIHDVLRLHDDGGAIYTDSNQPGTEIYGNWIHDISKGKWADPFPINGIYLDNNSKFIKVHDNKFSNITNMELIKENSGVSTRSYGNFIQSNTLMHAVPAVMQNIGLQKKQ